MSRSPLAYPLTRTTDTDVGGAADLQTDVMRFMAILSLCLVAIFALVQSIPLAPIEPDPEPAVERSLAKEPDSLPAPEPVGASSLATESEKPVVLTRAKWAPKYQPSEFKSVASDVAPVTSEAPPVEPVHEGFTLRFASDAALMRAVAAHHVGLYAIAAGKTKRMTVADSRISFWDASTPNAFHEMESRTVPAPVMDALARTGVPVASVAWGVTLPGKMTTQVDMLMQQHSGGSLIIAASGEIHWQAAQ